MKKTIIERCLYGMVASVLIGTVLCGCAKQNDDENRVSIEREEEFAGYAYDFVSRGDVVKKEKIRCTYRQTKQQDVSFALTGKRVEKVYVKKGDTVKTGDLLAELSGGNLQSEIKRLEYVIKRNELLMGYADTNEKIAIEEKKNSGLSDEELEKEIASIKQTYRYQKEDYEDALELDRLELAELKKEETNSRVYAQMDGNVYFVKELLEGSTSTAEEVVISIMDSDECFFEANSPEFSKYFSEDQNLDLSLAYGSTDGDLVVKPWHMDEWGETQSFLVVSKPENTNLEVGKEGTITVETGRRENVITVPVTSLYTADGKDYVYVLGDNNMREVRWVEVGLCGNDRIEILSGLQEGERVVRR